MKSNLTFNIHQASNKHRNIPFNFHKNSNNKKKNLKIIKKKKKKKK